MSATVRAGVAIFVVGLLFIWLIRPIGNACPDLDKLPSGSEASSAPSLAPPLTRTCTYTTPEGTKARRRYVPVLDVIALLLVAGLVSGATARARPRARERAPQAPKRPSVAEVEEARRERDAAERARARQERDARRRR